MFFRLGAVASIGSGLRVADLDLASLHPVLECLRAGGCFERRLVAKRGQHLVLGLWYAE